MPPQVRITREQIVKAAVEIVRVQGESALNARSVAAALGCSTQPVFSNFASMDELRAAVIAEAESRYRQIIERETASGLYPPYKASGMAYLRFAREEKELFKLLYMRDRSQEDLAAEDSLTSQVMGLLTESVVLAEETGKLFYLEMWSCVHGLAVMLATGYYDLDDELISRVLTDIFQGLKNRFEQEGA